MARVISKLPANPRRGDEYALKRKGRIITFRATGNPRLKWRIVSNKKAR